MRIYEGIRTNDGCIVTVDGMPLSARFDVRNHSPTGFEWGYCGSGPAQLALAILCDCIGVYEAQQYYQEFKFRWVASLQTDRWMITSEDVQTFLEAIRGES